MRSIPPAYRCDNCVRSNKHGEARKNPVCRGCVAPSGTGSRKPSNWREDFDAQQAVLDGQLERARAVHAEATERIARRRKEVPA
jgi:hypothetical protein